MNEPLGLVHVTKGKTNLTKQTSELSEVFSRQEKNPEMVKKNEEVTFFFICSTAPSL